ncbi:divalent-cation tolerance protein CutA [Achromobacter aloeverae]|uniref:Divalent-cation tolerance protein CutA n=1 Tax=Achromobacter aloeverae TaxID=1750518 RepID=A0A4Q1HGT4_9BURK|nr:divalent-cation tolerance protein CutA [Achromobacter aloeverae]RXN86702.1 divalent-cation tolerance protein CutA [Achromobacter aloeverae]
MPQQDDIVMVFSSAPDLLLAKRIAHIVVEEGLAACVNLGAPMLSIYTWKGEVEGAEEVPMCFKTTVGRLEALVESITRQHPYEVPEVVAVPVVGGAPAYLDWVREQTAGGRPPA